VNSADRGSLEDDETSATRISFSGQCRKAGSRPDWKSSSELRHARDHVAVVPGIGDQQDHAGYLQVALLRRDPALERLDVTETRLGLDDGRQVDPLDDRIRTATVTGDRHRDFRTPPDVVWQSTPAAFEEREMGFVAHGFPIGMDADVQLKAEDRGQSRGEFDRQLGLTGLHTANVRVGHSNLTGKLALTHAVADPGIDELGHDLRPKLPNPAGAPVRGSFRKRHASIVAGDAYAPRIRLGDGLARGT
jgi:hypothetical protein